MSGLMPRSRVPSIGASPSRAKCSANRRTSRIREPESEPAVAQRGSAARFVWWRQPIVAVSVKRILPGAAWRGGTGGLWDDGFEITRRS